MIILTIIVFGIFYNNTNNNIISKINNSTSYKKLITISYPQEALIKTFGIVSFPEIDGYTISIKDVEKMFKIQCLRNYSAGKYYIVYKTKENGLFYVFLKKYNTNIFFTHSLYILNNINEQKFLSLKIGDARQKVEDIDSIMKITNSASIKANRLFIHNTSTSIHFVNGSIYAISYIYKNNIAYIAKIEKLKNKIYTNGNTSLDYTIFSKDTV